MGQPLPMLLGEDTRIIGGTNGHAEKTEIGGPSAIMPLRRFTHNETNIMIGDAGKRRQRRIVARGRRVSKKTDVTKVKAAWSADSTMDAWKTESRKSEIRVFDEECAMLRRPPLSCSMSGLLREAVEIVDEAAPLHRCPSHVALEVRPLFPQRRRTREITGFVLLIIVFGMLCAGILISGRRISFDGPPLQSSGRSTFYQSPNFVIVPCFVG